MIAFACNNTIWAHERMSRRSIGGPGNQKSFVVAAKPIFAGPSVIKVVMRFPTIYIIKFVNVLTLFTNNHMSIDTFALCFRRLTPILKIFSSKFNIFKQRFVKIQVYGFLIMQKYKINFLNIISAVVKQCIRITASWWITEKCSSAWNVLIDPRPECVVVNFVNSNHV